MTGPPHPAATPAPPATVAQAAAFGADALQALQRIDTDAALIDTPAQTLVTRLGALHLALQSHAPARIRRQVGWFGRLLGRDVELQAQSEALAGRLGVLLLDAEGAAQALAGHGRQQGQVQQQLEAALAELDLLASRADAWCQQQTAAPDAHLRDALRQRVQHLRQVHAAHALLARQLGVLQAQTHDLLARHRTIGDVLVPAWRQQALGQAARAGADHAMQAAHAQAAIGAELAAMAATLDTTQGRLRAAPDQENAT